MDIIIESMINSKTYVLEKYLLVLIEDMSTEYIKNLEVRMNYKRDDKLICNQFSSENSLLF